LIGTFVGQLPAAMTQWTMLVIGDLLLGSAILVAVAKAAWDNHNQM